MTEMDENGMLRITLEGKQPIDDLLARWRRADQSKGEYVDSLYVSVQKFDLPVKDMLRTFALNADLYDVLDYGCGYGFDANYYKWDKFDPYYFDNYPSTKFQNIVCINVLNVVSKKIRQEIITNIKELLNDNGIAYLCVPRNIPIKPGESGEIEINFDSTNMPNLQSKLIKVFANVPSGSVFLRIQALVEPKNN